MVVGPPAGAALKVNMVLGNSNHIWDVSQAYQRLKL